MMGSAGRRGTAAELATLAATRFSATAAPRQT